MSTDYTTIIITFTTILLIYDVNYMLNVRLDIHVVVIHLLVLLMITRYKNHQAFH